MVEVRDVEVRGVLAGRDCTSRSAAPQREEERRATPPMQPRSTLSVKSCARCGRAPAPSAMRTRNLAAATGGARQREARRCWSEVSSGTKPTAPRSTSSAGRASPCSCRAAIDVGAARALVSGCAAASPAATARSSARALATVTPGRRRATTRSHGARRLARGRAARTSGVHSSVCAGWVNDGGMTPRTV